MIKQEVHQIKGMQRDLTVSKFNPEFAFDTQNIRITARDGNNLLSVTNEKGTKELVLKSTSGEVTSVEGTLIGYNVLNEYLTLFTTGDTDRIYRAEVTLHNTNVREFCERQGKRLAEQGEHNNVLGLFGMEEFRLGMLRDATDRMVYFRDRRDGSKVSVIDLLN